MSLKSKIKEYLEMMFTNPNSPKGYTMRAKRLRETFCVCGHHIENHIDNTCVIGCKCKEFKNLVFSEAKDKC